MTVGVIAAAVTLLLPGSALASGTPSGVHVDPGSPAGKEYQLPVSSARGEASGTSGSSNVPLFGSGITPSGPSGTGGATSSTGSSAAASGTRPRTSPTHKGAAARRAHAVTAGVTSASRPAVSVTPSPAITSSSAGGSGWLALVGGGAAVLVLGGGGGFLVRRRVLHS